MSYNRCKNIHKFGNKYLPSAYKTQVEFRSHFSGKGASYGPRNMVIFLAWHSHNTENGCALYIIYPSRVFKVDPFHSVSINNKLFLV